MFVDLVLDFFKGLLSLTISTVEVTHDVGGRTTAVSFKVSVLIVSAVSSVGFETTSNDVSISLFLEESATH